MVPFEYRRISQDFIRELSERVSDGESAVLLGPRYIGKRYVLNCLLDHLQAAGVESPIQIGLLRDASVTTGRKVLELISQALESGVDNLCADEHPMDSFLRPIDQLWSQAHRPVFLLAANVDGMAHRLARHFLEEVRTRVESGRMVVVLSGEDDFRDLVHGPKSEFNCANQYVLQGFAEDEFKTFVSRYAADLNVRFENHEEVCDRLYRLTGGNIYVLRLLLWAIIEARLRSSALHTTPIKVTDIADSLETLDVPGIHESPVLRHATRLIAREPGCWSDLDSIIRGGPVHVGLTDHAPGPLELAGVAIRDGDQLQFASPLMERFVLQYYDNRRFGDLYARDDQWDKAFERYILLDPEERMRPAGINDTADVEFTMRALGAALYSASTKGVQNVKQLFTQGCRYVLGFREVTFWRHDAWAGWQLQPSDDLPPNKDITDKVMEVLRSSEPVSPGVLPVPEPLNRFAVAAILPALRFDQQEAVVVSDFEKRVVISRERERLVEDLLHCLVEAHTRAIAVEGKQIRLCVRDQHVEIASSIFDSLGSRVLDVGHALAMAARGLRNLGYRRVLFCLVDPKGEKIQGVLDDSDDPDVNVAEMTDWSLEDPMKDLQPYVIHTRRSKIVEDASREPLANQDVVLRARMKAEAIVPILNRAGDAIGTIHVERADGAIPSQQEVEDLEAFGRLLAIGIEQSERVNLLQSALDKIPEPVVIADRLERPRYANKPAAELLGVQQGWRDQAEAEPFSHQETGVILQYLRESLARGHRLLHHVRGLGTEPEYCCAILTDNIQDWRERTVGALLHIQDLNYLYRVFEAFRLIAEANDTDSAMHSMLEATELLGHKWGRFYLIDEKDPERFINRLSFGFEDPRAKAKFDTGLVNLARRSEPNNESWKSIEHGTPLVFCYMPDLDDGERLITPQGLEVINVKKPNCRDILKKNPGDFWLDFPLITQKRALGKLTLQCDENLRPEDFELLGVLSEMSAGVLDAFLRRESEFERREQWIREAAEQTMAVTAHNISTRLAALPILLTRYRWREEDFPRLKELNDQFFHILNETQETVKRVKERLSAVRPRFSTFDIVMQLQHAMCAALPEGTWALECEEQPLEIQADSHLLENALIELIQNSREAAVDPEDMLISVAIESVQRGSQDWVRIVFKDNGPGVPAHLKQEIFEDFFSRRPGRKAGTGLGLGFVRRVMEAHGGTSREDGQPGQGATFVIEMPRFAVIDEEKEESLHVPHSYC